VSPARIARASHQTSALLLRRVEHGESDLVLALFTRDLGRIPALARSARRSRKRFGGSLEPFHTLRIEVDEPTAAGELYQLREAQIETMRLGLTEDLERMDAAGRALAWVRAAAPPRIAEPEVWSAITSLLDRLNAANAPASGTLGLTGAPRALNPKLVLAEEGMRLLSAFGWGLELERCVRCGRPCEEGKAALIDPVRGGLVCRACGGARLRVSGALRARLMIPALEPEDVDVALDLVERALEAHAGTGGDEGGKRGKVAPPRGPR
jgi:DNA repair protein RecO (recombination protein O)